MRNVFIICLASYSFEAGKRKARPESFIILLQIYVMLYHLFELFVDLFNFVALIFKIRLALYLGDDLLHGHSFEI